jgi:hypothetical protein
VGFVIEVNFSSIHPRAWGCQTALAGVRLSARMVFRAYLALHPHARLWFFLGFVVVVGFSVLNGRFLCLALDSMQFLDTAIVCIVTNS